MSSSSSSSKPLYREGRGADELRRWSSMRWVWLCVLSSRTHGKVAANRMSLYHQHQEISKLFFWVPKFIYWTCNYHNCDLFLSFICIQYTSHDPLNLGMKAMRFVILWMTALVPLPCSCAFWWFLLPFTTTLHCQCFITCLYTTAI